MTLKELFNYCSSQLAFGDCGDFEAQCIFEDILKIKRNAILIDNSTVSENDITLIKK